MKSIWLIISAVALANVLAIGGFVGWLAATDRLSKERVARVREVFGETVAVQKARETDEGAKAEAAKKEAEEAAKLAKTPLTAAEQLAARVDVTEIDRQRSERLRKEIADLRKAMLEQETKLTQDREALAKEKAAFEQMRKQIADTEMDAQFKKTLSVLETLKADKAKIALKQMIDDDAANGRVTAVTYLNSMEEAARTKIVGEFIKDDPKLAADLLQRLRNHGLVAAVSGARSP